MSLRSFELNLRGFLSSDPDILIDVPPGSGICRIVPVSSPEYIPGHVSCSPGRWNHDGTSALYGADGFSICAKELGLSEGNLPGCTFEYWETQATISAVDISAFPNEIREVFFERKGPPPFKWECSHALIDEINRLPQFKDVEFIYAPSASGMVTGVDGMCSRWNPHSQPIELQFHGTHEDYKSGKFTLS